MLKLVRQSIRLGVFWMAICASLGGMLVYTKASLEILLADYIAEPAGKSAPVQQPRPRAQ